MGEMLMQIKKEQRTEPTSSSIGSSRCTRKSGNSWGKVKHNIKLDMKSTGLIISSRLETAYGFTSTRRYRRVKEIKSSPFIMDPSLSWRKVVPMIFVRIFHLICRFT
jgi:hypothetical protein